MPLSPDVISWILEFPVFIASLRDLLRKNPELRGQSEKLLDEAIARIQRYAELHFALRDWKTLHHDLHEMLIAFQNSTQFASLINTSEKLPSLRNVQTRWQIFETQSLDPFLAKKPELAH